MAPRNRQTPPSQRSTPAEHALTTPNVRPEVLLALQQNQSAQAINNECAAIRQEIGAMKAGIVGLKGALKEHGDSVSGIRKTHHIVLGVGLAIAALIGVVWYLIGHKVSTLLTMADEREISHLHKPDSAIKNSN